MTESKIIAIDTETTSLRPDRRAWEIGLIDPQAQAGLRHPAGRHAEWEPGQYRWFIARNDLDLGNADPFSLKIGGFYDRHPQFADATFGHVASEVQALREVERITRGAHLLGALPSFDVEVLGARMRAHGITPSWHYHVIDIEPLAVGYLHGIGEGAGWSLPWASDDLSRAIGVEPPSEEDRHTALGDARWALRLYEAITRSAPSDEGE